MMASSGSLQTKTSRLACSAQSEAPPSEEMSSDDQVGEYAQEHGKLCLARHGGVVLVEIAAPLAEEEVLVGPVLGGERDGGEEKA